ncbi:MAG: outer membrane protein multidrug efflux system [Desulfovibrionales bacterium]|nr:outer membrane protein multidrug efflux system [Desulfovibrionales bacterium]
MILLSADARRLMLGLALLFAAGSILAGCGKNYTDAEATAAVAPQTITNRTAWSGSAGEAGEIQDNWIEDFRDPELEQLVREAVSANPSLQAASARVEQAQALAAQARSALAPSVGVGAQYAGLTRGDVSKPLSGAGLGVSWEADVWGRVGLGAQAAEESARAVEADYEFARQSLAAATAKAWFLACETQQQLGFLHEVSGLVERMSSIVEKRREVGRVSMQDVHQIKAQLASVHDAETKADIAHQEAVRALEVLLGRYPEDQVQAIGELDAKLSPIPVGMPSSMLERRPDLLAAQRRAASAFYAEKSAELLRLPSFTISAGAGASGLGGAIAGLTAGVFAPLYTGGRIEAQMKQASAAQKEAVAAYAAAALQAFKEVENSLAGEELLANRDVFLKEAADESKKAYELAQVQYKVGKVDLFQVLDLQTRWIGSEITLLDVEREQLDNRVDLHLALGGSFDSGAQ